MHFLCNYLLTLKFHTQLCMVTGSKWDHHFLSSLGKNIRNFWSTQQGHTLNKFYALAQNLMNNHLLIQIIFDFKITLGMQPENVNVNPKHTFDFIWSSLWWPTSFVDEGKRYLEARQSWFGVVGVGLSLGFVVHEQQEFSFHAAWWNGLQLNTAIRVSEFRWKAF